MNNEVVNRDIDGRELVAGLNKEMLTKILPTNTELESYSLKFELTPDAKQIVSSLRQQAKESAPQKWLDAVTAGIFPTKESESSWDRNSGELQALRTVLQGIPNAERPQFIDTAVSVLVKCPAKMAIPAGELLSKLYDEARDSKTELNRQLIESYSKKLLDSLFIANQDLHQSKTKDQLKTTVSFLNQMLNKPETSQGDIRILNSILGRAEGVPLQEKLEFAHKHQLATGQATLSARLVEQSWKEILGYEDAEFKSQFLKSYARVSMESLQQERSQSGIVKQITQIVDSHVDLEINSWSHIERKLLIKAFLSQGAVSQIVQIAGKDCEQLLEEVRDLARTTIQDTLDIVLFDRIANTFNLDREEHISASLLDSWKRKVDELIGSGKVEDAAELTIKHAVVSHYKNTGTTLESISTAMGIESGKIMLIEITDGEKAKIVIRGYYEHSYSRGEFHRDIISGFEREMRMRGLERLDIRPLGGAHISVPRGDEAITISGRSEDYGECDKALALQLVKKAFPNREVQIKSR
jgi:hypothetical protein